MNYVIITGISRGLGEAIARRLLAPGNHLVGIARHPNSHLESEAAAAGVPFDFHPFDLCELDGIDALLDAVFAKLGPAAAGDRISLINNAAMVPPVEPAGRYHAGEVRRHFALNLMAPILLTSGFIRHTEEWHCSKRVVNISSGAAKSPMPSWGCYCGAKAGLEMFTRCVGAEQGRRRRPAEIVAFDPGVIDTDMQAGLRALSEQDFPGLPYFLDLKEHDRLAPPEAVADKVIRLLNAELIEQGGVVNVKDQS